MNYKDPDITRLLKAISNETADRVPNFEIIIRQRNVDAILGERGVSRATQLSPADYVELASRIGMDAINVRVRWKIGWIDERTDHYKGGNIRGWEDIQGATPLDISPFMDRVDTLVEVAKPEKIGVCIVLGGPFSQAYLSMGFSEFCLALYSDPTFVNGLLDIMTDFDLHVIEELVKHEIAFLIIADDIGLNTGLMVRPSMLEELWVPRVSKLIKKAKESNLPVVLHSDGDISEILPSIVKLGFDGIHPFQPVGEMDIYRAKEEVGDQLCLFGNIDLSGVLSYGSPEEVADDVKEHIEKLAIGGGYVCGSSHAILDSVPPENFEALIEAVHRFG